MYNLFLGMYFLLHYSSISQGAFVLPLWSFVCSFLQHVPTMCWHGPWVYKNKRYSPSLDSVQQGYIKGMCHHCVRALEMTD